MTLANLRKDLRKLADPDKAKILQGFFKTGRGQYGEGDIFLGIVLPEQRQVVKKYAQAISLSELSALIRSRIHEERLVALLILVKKFKDSDTVGKQETIYNFYLRNTKHINNWDLVDLSAPKIVGAYLHGRDKKVLYRLAKSQNLWERRIAILSTFHDIYYGQPKDALRISKLLLADRHDLIHKAVGWMLREIGKRCGEKYLLKFLGDHAQTMPRTMLRYAIERLPEQQRLSFLKKPATI